MAKTSIKLSTAILMALTFGSSPAWSGDLRDAMTQAYNNSGLLEQNRALLRAADEDVAQAMAALRPVVGWSAGTKRTFVSSTNPQADSEGYQTSVGLSASLTLYDGGSSKNAVEAAKETVLSVRESLIGYEQQVLLDAVQAYMDVRSASETVALRQNNLRVIKEELKAAQDRFDVGEVTKTDVALAEARLAASTAQLAAAEGMLDQANAAYQAAVGVSPSNLKSPPSAPKLPKTVKEAQAMAVRNHPNMKQLQHDIKAAELNVKRSEAASGPTVTLSGTYGMADAGKDDVFTRSGQIQLGAQGSVYSGGKIPSLIRKAKAGLAARQAALHLTRVNIEKATATSFALLDMARSSRRASEEQIRAAQVAFDGVREEATLGARTTLDVLNAEQELLNAKASLISALADEQVAGYRVLAQMGQLTVDHLNLPVQKYDPAAYYNLVKDAPSTESKQGKELDRVLKALGQK